jgi:hypothetical protein
MKNAEQTIITVRAEKEEIEQMIGQKSQQQEVESAKISQLQLVYSK